MVLLGLDIGTSGTKALLLKPDGTVAATAESPHELQMPRPGWTQQHPEHWWRAALDAMAKVLRRAHLKSSQITAIGLSGQMHGSVFLGDGPKPLRPALLWNDQRTVEQCRWIETAAGGREQLISQVSNPALTGYTAPKILWFKQHEPALYEKCRHILLPKDYIRYRLTGEYVSEVSDASGTLLLNVKTRQWHDELIARLELDRSMLPPVVESQQITGRVTPLVTGKTGLPAGIPVVGGAGDQAAGAVGTGVVRPGLLSAALGTSGVIFAAAATPQTDPQGRVQTMCHAIPNTWCVFGCMLSAGGSLQWLRNTLYADQVQALQKKDQDPGLLYERMMAAARSVSPGAENLFFLPYLNGERCPHADPNARGCFIGLTPRHSAPHLVRAVVEGITYGLREQVDILRSMNIPIEQIRTGGGGARSDFWRQLQADMYQAPVVTINVSEGAALGAAILAGVGIGVWPSVPAATERIIKVRRRSTPNGRRAAFYQQQHQKFAGLYPILRETFANLDVGPAAGGVS